MIFDVLYVQMPKLTLSVNDAVVTRAKRYAKQKGTSVSAMVEIYLSSIAEPHSHFHTATPALRALRGSLKKANLTDYKRHLDAKYK
jgi:hypothetical protein